MPYNIGAIGPRPCELHSRWRRYALTSRDQLRDRKVSWWKHLTVEDIGGGKFVWKVDGNVRTVTTSPPVGIDGTALTLGARHKIIHEQGSSWQVDCVGEYNMIHNMYILCLPVDLSAQRSRNLVRMSYRSSKPFSNYCFVLSSL